MDEIWKNWEIKEFLKCSEDFKYFLENYVKIPTSEGVIAFKLNVEQLYMYNLLFFSGVTNICGDRQTGKSTLVCAYLLWQSLFNEHNVSVIFSYKHNIGKDNISKIKFMIDNLPSWLQSRFCKLNANSIELSNGSKIHNRLIRYCKGVSINTLFIDAVDFLSSEDMRDLNYLKKDIVRIINTYETGYGFRI